MTERDKKIMEQRKRRRLSKKEREINWNNKKKCYETIRS